MTRPSPSYTIRLQPHSSFPVAKCNIISSPTPSSPIPTVILGQNNYRHILLRSLTLSTLIVILTRLSLRLNDPHTVCQMNRLAETQPFRPIAELPIMPTSRPPPAPCQFLPQGPHDSFICPIILSSYKPLKALF